MDIEPLAKNALALGAAGKFKRRRHETIDGLSFKAALEKLP